MTNDPAAELREYLSNLGQLVDLRGKVTALPPVDRKGNGQVIVLDRVKQDAAPPYCIHGYSECIQCHEPVWLGHETEKIVSRGQAYPICIDCARTDIPRTEEPISHVQDHLRRDGPHG